MTLAAVTVVRGSDVYEFSCRYQLPALVHCGWRACSVLGVAAGFSAVPVVGYDRLDAYR